MMIFLLYFFLGMSECVIDRWTNMRTKIKLI